MRKAIGVAAAAAMIAGTVGLAVPATADDTSSSARSVSATVDVSKTASDSIDAQRLRCGATIKRLHDGPGPWGNKRWNIYYKNCSSRTVKRKVDIKFADDLSCKKVKPRKTAKWYYETGHFGPDVPRSVKAC
ncbi:hypothetical protein [Streptomyces sp. NPDC020607]|uniref:hypothetical protein n=1 Tax=Streptomyces sp. NPDC020607 TaxID=3365082 RepID=UPI0037AE6E82